MIDFDRFVFFGETPTEWLQAHLHEPGVVQRVGRRLHPRLHLLLHRPLRGRRRPLGPRPARLPALRKRLVTLAAGRPRDLHRLSRRRRPGWPAKWACSTASNARPRRAGRCSASAPPGSSRTRPGRASTWSPPSPRCTPPSPRWWRCSSGAGCGRAGGRCWPLYPLAMGLTLIATGEHYFFDVPARLALRRRRDGRLGLVGTAPAQVDCASPDLSESIVSTASGSTPLADASSSDTRSPSITAQSMRAVRLPPSTGTRTTSVPAAAISSR